MDMINTNEMNVLAITIMSFSQHNEPLVNEIITEKFEQTFKMLSIEQELESNSSIVSTQESNSTSISFETPEILKRKRRWSEISNETKHCHTNLYEQPETKRRQKSVGYSLRNIVDDSYQPGFKDGDFHIINESDEVWIINDDQISKNVMLTELVLNEREIKMVNETKFNLS